MKSKEKIVLALAVALAVLQNCSAVTYTWKGGDGDWSDPSHWTGGAANGYPNERGDIAKFPVNTEPITVTVDVTTTITQLVFVADASAVSKPVTLAGSGKLTLSASGNTLGGSSISLSSNRKFVLATSIAAKYIYLSGTSDFTLEDNADLTHNSIFVYGNSTMTVNGGSIRSGSSTCSMTIRGGGTFIQNGGYVYTRLNVVGESNQYGMGTFVLNGGVFYNRYRDATTIADDGAFTLNGGTFRQDGAWSTNCIDWASRIYPVKRGQVTDVIYYSGYGNKTKYFNPFGQANVDYVAETADAAPAFTNDYPFAGTLMCTNTPNEEYAQFSIRYAKATVGRPGGVIICNRLDTAGMLTEVDFRLSKIILKHSLRIVNNRTQLNFPNGIEFGAFDHDWSSTSKDATVTDPAYINLYGDCTINTTDYFDGETARTISLYNLNVGRNRTSLIAKGCGVAKAILSSKTFESFRRIEVQDGCTLELDRHSNMSAFRVITANELELGRNAMLKINPSRSRVDAIRTKIDPTAKIHVTVFDSMTTYRNVLVASLGNVDGEIDESNFIIDNQSQTVNWRLARSGNTFYITDDSPAQPPTSTTSGRSRWTGAAGNGLWSDAGNWDNGVPQDANTYADFYDASSWAVTNDIDNLTVRLLYFQGGGSGGAACGPYILYGKPITIGVGNSVYNTGGLRFPAIVNNHLSRTTSGGNLFFNSGANGDNSVTLAGGLNVPANNTYTSLNGDWRLGGEVTTKALVPGVRSNEDARPDKFTILSNATATISSQGTKTNNYAAAVRYHIERTGQLKFTGGTSLDFPARFAEAYHTIYGTLDVGIPLKFGVDQHFHGTGEVRVSSVDDFAGTKARVHLSGGVTLKPAAWATATAADDGVTAITVDGVATMAPTADMTYGAADVGVTSTAEERALEIMDAGVLTLVANEGRTVTFADPISGEGKLIISGSGTVSLPGGVEVGELAFDGGPTLKVSGENPVVASNAISLDGVGMDVVDTSGFSDWRTVLSAPEITGTPTLPPNFKANVEIVDGHAELRLKELRGLVITIN